VCKHCRAARIFVTSFQGYDDVIKRCKSKVNSIFKNEQNFIGIQELKHLSRKMVKITVTTYYYFVGNMYFLIQLIKNVRLKLIL
jgi:hypothetical protein